MKAVLDANSLISARITPRGTNARILDAAEEGRFEMVLSELLIKEVGVVLERSKFRRYFPVEEVPKYISRLFFASALFSEGGEENPRSFVDDPKDDYLVELALAARADVIVSGDRHLHEEVSGFRFQASGKAFVELPALRLCRKLRLMPEPVSTCRVFAET